MNEQRYTLTKEYEREEDYYLFPIKEKVIANEAIGDFIGVCSTDNVLWLLIYNYDKSEIFKIREFIETYFKNPIETYLYINKKGILNEN